MTATALSPTAVTLTDSPPDSPPLTPAEVIAHIVLAHGDLQLAAENSHLPLPVFASLLPSVDKDELADAIRTSITISTFHAFTTTKHIVLATLDDLSAPQTAKLMLDLLNTLSGIVAPPPAVQSPNSSTSVQLNLVNQMNSEAENARDALTQRLIALDDTPTESPIDQHSQPTATISAPIRLGTDSAPGTDRTLQMEHLVDHDGPGLGQDQDGRRDSA